MPLMPDAALLMLDADAAAMLDAADDASAMLMLLMLMPPLMLMLMMRCCRHAWCCIRCLRCYASLMMIFCFARALQDAVLMLRAMIRRAPYAWCLLCHDIMLTMFMIIYYARLSADAARAIHYYYFISLRHFRLLSSYFISLFSPLFSFIAFRRHFFFDIDYWYLIHWLFQYYYWYYCSLFSLIFIIYYFSFIDAATPLAMPLTYYYWYRFHYAIDIDYSIIIDIAIILVIFII